MAIQLDSTFNPAILTIPVAPDYNDDWTWCGWRYFEGLGGAVAAPVSIGTADFHDVDGGNVGSGSDVLSIFMKQADAYEIIEAGTTTLVTGKWYFLAVVRSGDDLIGYLASETDPVVQEVLGSSSPAGRTAATQVQMRSFTAARDFRIAKDAIWEGVALTAVELEAERVRATAVPVRTADRWGYWAFATNGDLAEGGGTSARDYVLDPNGAALHTATDPVVPGAVLSGTAVGGITEADIVASGKFSDITMTGGLKWIP